MALQAAYGAWPYTEITCYRCAVKFGMPDSIYERRKADHDSFWCPNGHEQHFTGQTPDQKRIAELEREVQFARSDAEHQRSSRKWAETRAKGANIAAGKAKAAQRRLIARVHAGVCPHCNRTFKQLAAHMKSKHSVK